MGSVFEILEIEQIDIRFPKTCERGLRTSKGRIWPLLIVKPVIMLDTDTSHNDDSIETIEARIHQLERVIQSSHADTDGTPILPRLTGISKEMGQALSGRDRIAPLIRMLKELQGYLEPTFGES